MTGFSAAAEQYRKHGEVSHRKSIFAVERHHHSQKHDSLGMQPPKPVLSLEMKLWQVERLLQAQNNSPGFWINKRKKNNSSIELRVY